jgi:hypothetical protein
VQVTGDFTQSNNCPAVLAAGSSCTVNVVFAPTAAGNWTGTLAISDDASGSPQSTALSGAGSGPVVALTPANLTFPSTQVGVPSAAQTVTLANLGNAALTIASIQVTGDFAQTNNCGTSLAAGSSCVLNITFTPASAGNLAGLVTIADNAAASPQTVALSGSGLDFSLAISPSATTVEPGATATYTLTIAPLGGAFNNTIKLSCNGAPQESTCSLSPTSATPGAKSTTVTVSISTTASSADARFPVHSNDRPFYASWITFSGLAFLGIVIGLGSRSKEAYRLGTLVLAGTLLLITGCAGGTGINSQNQGTPPGTCTVTVTGTSGALQHSVPLTLTVQ